MVWEHGQIEFGSDYFIGEEDYFQWEKDLENKFFNIIGSVGEHSNESIAYEGIFIKKIHCLVIIQSAPTN